MPPYSALVRARTVRLYEDGLSCRAVAELVKVEGLESPHYVTILRWAREAGKGRRLHGWSPVARLWRNHSGLVRKGHAC